MDPLNLITQPSGVFALASGLAAVAILLWWLVRRRMHRQWLPIIRVLKLESRILPRLVWRSPPWIPFLSFLVLAMAVLLFSLKPSYLVHSEEEPKQTRVHIFVDMSPSVAGVRSSEALANEVAGIYKSLGTKARVTVSTSHSDRMIEPRDAGEIMALVAALPFHRGGLKLGHAIKASLEKTEGLDRLFIVTDRDQNSWAGFNWRYLKDEMEVSFYPLTAEGSGALANMYLREARFLSAGAEQTMEWEIDVARTSDSAPATGQLIAYVAADELAQVQFSIPEGRSRAAVRIQWPASKISRSSASQGKNKGAGDLTQEHLRFVIVPSGADALALDNELKTPLLGLSQEALIIAQPTSEHAIEDPANTLGISLGVLGFKVTRRDSGEGISQAALASPLWVLMGGSRTGVDSFCPKLLKEKRLQRTAAQPPGPQLQPKSPSRLPMVWLAPAATDADYGELCRCYARLMKEGEDEVDPRYCESISSRNQWVGVLTSLGAKQLGGEFGDASSAIAYTAKHAASGLAVTAFTVPLHAGPGGLSHTALPVVTRDLLQLQGFVAAGGRQAVSAWPRVEDLSALWGKPSEEASAALSNVPHGESLMVQADDAGLPPRWTAQMDAGERALALKKERHDPLPWIKLLALIVALVLILEGVLLSGKLLMSYLFRRPETLVLLILWLAAPSPGAEAKVELALLGAETRLSFATLSRELAHRTSVELAPKPLVFLELTSEALEQPWLWVKDVTAIVDNQGRMHKGLLQWLRRGGFLIVESSGSEQSLIQLLANLSTASGEDGLLPLPPDHELMRSFYLLDALPGCQGTIWRGLQYDGRLAMVAIPYDFTGNLADSGRRLSCPNAPDFERSVRVFVNLTMVALATDYKKDQIHLPEILKRLR